MSIVGGQGTETQEKRKEQRVKGRDPRKNIGISATLHPEKTGFPLRSTPKKRDLRYATTGRDQGLNYRA